eukprot:84827_1
MALDTSYAETIEYLWMHRALSSVLELMMLCIFTKYTYDCIQKMRMKSSEKSTTQNESGSKWSILSRVFLFLTLFTYCIHGVNYTFNICSLYNESISCDAIKKFSLLSYHVGKVFLYIVLVLRVKTAYHGSSFNDNILVKYTLFLIYFLLLCFVIGLFVEGFIIHGTLTYVNDNVYYCVLEPLPLWGFICFGLLDSFTSILCVAVFIYPLKIILKSNSDYKLIQLVKKYTILTITAIVSTLVCVLAMTMFNLGWIGLFDNIINSMSLLCMISWYKTVYTKMCCCKCWDERNKKSEKSISEKKVSNLPTQSTGKESNIEIKMPSINMKVVSDSDI